VKDRVNVICKFRLINSSQLYVEFRCDASHLIIFNLDKSLYVILVLLYFLHLLQAIQLQLKLQQTLIKVFPVFPQIQKVMSQILFIPVTVFNLYYVVIKFANFIEDFSGRKEDILLCTL